jgi:beta-galactosidase
LENCTLEHGLNNKNLIPLKYMKNRNFSSAIVLFICLFLLSCCASKSEIDTKELVLSEEGRSELLFDAGWRFYRGDTAGAEKPEFDDSDWRLLDLPHDWSIEDLPETVSPFNAEAVSAVGGGFTTGGKGWYRKTFNMPEMRIKKRVLIQFDGVYMNPVIYLNGDSIGNNPYGYTSFWIDITDKMRSGKPNVIAVKVRNDGANSRWYSGSGIYRHVWLKVTDPVSIAQWGTGITTPVVSKDSATVIVRNKVNNKSDSLRNIKLTTRILNSNGEQVKISESVHLIEKLSSFEFGQEFSIKNPDLWSTETPALYTSINEVYYENKLVDRTETRFGIRSISFDVVNGFQLNGKTLKLKGGCLHHDNGPLGSKSFDRAEERRIELLKASGFNAIRCSHNPPSQAFLDACDRIGMLVIDEAFDMWQDQKNPFDYHLYFNDWWQRDIESMILRDRNHPSVIMWSIGNEIPGRQKPEVVAVAQMLSNFVKNIDNSRPVTSAVNELKPDKDPFFSTLGIAGYNYAAGGDHLKKSLYEFDHKRVPERIMYGAESYPLEAFQAWQDVIDNPFVIGDFVWTAFDYIGEASIGWRGYPQEKSFYPWNLAWCGDIDICGWKRPQSYYRDALWMENQLSLFVTSPKPTFEPNPKRESWSKWHWDDVAADWNWSGYENIPIEVIVYSSCEEVELFLNNKSIGKSKTDRSNEFKAKWLVPYQAGELAAVGYTGGQQVNKTSIVTAQKPTDIKLSADRSQIKADGQDLSYITVELLDENGVRNPKADDLVKFEIDGPGKIIGVGNANPTSTESYLLPERKAWQGRCMVIIRSEKNSGEIRIKASSGDLKPSVNIIRSF